ncbi:FecR domain-containing protein [Methylophaga sp.]|uniref:FecR domain-containing protein n=1 Tax=Methylophaga sp. TaxID=2024840 RepID=UPI003A8E1CC6
MRQTIQEVELDSEVLEQAADWLVRLNVDDVSESEQEAFERWRQACPDHAIAWSRAEQLVEKLGHLPSSLAMPALGRKVDKQRRRVLNKVLALLLVAPVGWGGWRLAKTQGWMADFHTAKGERREQKLADGSLLTLNTSTAVDVYFDDKQRLIRLHRGEVLIETAKEEGKVYRPLRLLSEQGILEALGTRFNVRQYESNTEITVIEGAVRIEPNAGSTQPFILSAGQQVSFTESFISKVQVTEQTFMAWTRGMMLADDMRLADFVSELARYHSGFLRVDPAISDIRISGAYPVANSEQTLRMLVATYPITMTSRLGGTWVTLFASKSKN